MINLKEIRTVIFDYDGTLHNSIKIYAPAFLKAFSYLVQNGYAENRSWSEKEISCWLGFNSKEMWDAFMPKLPTEIKSLCSNIVGEEMKRLVEEGKAVLYDGAIDTLKYLKRKGYCLVFLSNCKRYYRDEHSKTFNLESYFIDMVCSEDYDFIPKYEILGKIKESYPEKIVIVGDRNHDIDAGLRNNIYTIGCSYGFAAEGELSCADMVIDDITNLMKYL